MHRRPLSVSIVGWIMTIIGVFALLGALISMSMLDNPQVQKAAAASPLPLSVQMGFGIAAGVVTFVCGVNVLRGENWARWLFVGWCILAVVVGLFCSPDKIMIIPSVLINGTLILFLFLPKANDYFSRY